MSTMRSQLQSKPSSASLITFGLSIHGIDEEIVQNDIKLYLGDDAEMFGIDKGKECFLIRANQRLSNSMIEDLRADTKAWRKEKSPKSKSRYVNSKTYRDRRTIQGASRNNRPGQQSHGRTLYGSLGQTSEHSSSIYAPRGGIFGTSIDNARDQRHQLLYPKRDAIASKEDIGGDWPDADIRPVERVDSGYDSMVSSLVYDSAKANVTSAEPIDIPGGERRFSISSRAGSDGFGSLSGTSLSGSHSRRHDSQQRAPERLPGQYSSVQTSQARHQNQPVRRYPRGDDKGMPRLRLSGEQAQSQTQEHNDWDGTADWGSQGPEALAEEGGNKDPDGMLGWSEMQVASSSRPLPRRIQSLESGVENMELAEPKSRPSTTKLSSKDRGTEAKSQEKVNRHSTAGHRHRK